MKLNYCSNCGESLSISANFCSNCGTSLTITNSKKDSGEGSKDFKEEIKGFLEDFVEKNEDLLKELAVNLENGKDIKKGMFFSVEMRGGEPIIKSGDVKDLDKMVGGIPFFESVKKLFPQKNEGKIVFEEVEPEIIESSFGVKINVGFPGVNSVENIVTTPIEEGVEIVGKSDEKVYFSKVRVPDEMRIENTEFNEGVLTLTLR